ncbi:MAG: phosphoenolpyruvate--protein phosphotransferase [Oscillospiraceae bacterium]|nr:phosphoenolpyruvate--protein phosphotransferase [Oscillospiraceae bacterium]
MQLIKGISASEGLTLGTIREISRRYTGLGRVVQDRHREKALFEAACILAKDEIEALGERAAKEDKDIFTFHRMVLEDEGFLKEIENYILAGGGAAAAVERAAGVYQKRLRNIKDPYLSQRAVDISDVSRRVVDILDGRDRQKLMLKSPAIIVADEILPSDLVSIEREMILGFATVGGSTQSHAAIIARTMGIPAIVLAGEVLQGKDGYTAALDGATGELYIEPDDATRTRFLHCIKLAQRRSTMLEKLRSTPCVTKDGTRIELYANCTSPQDIAAAIEQGADGIGLLRSEFIFMGEEQPEEEHQYTYYCRCIQQAQGRPVVIRTFDLGADKAVEGVTPSQEDNPAMGLRGLRFSLARENMFCAQLSALLRAGLTGNLKVMFPMVATQHDVCAVMQQVENAKRKLREKGIPYSEKIEWGIMIETPAAAVTSDILAKQADFFSIGTNDLTQYTHAVDRMNPLVERYYLPDSEAVRRLITYTVQCAQAAGIEVSVCGESAAVPEIATEYVKIGVRRLSMAARAICQVKEKLLAVDLSDVAEREEVVCL